MIDPRGILEEFTERAACDHGYTLAAMFERQRIALNERRAAMHEPGTETLRGAAARLGVDHKPLAIWLRAAGVNWTAEKGKALRLPSVTFDRVVTDRRARRARPVRNTVAHVLDKRVAQ